MFQWGWLSTLFGFDTGGPLMSFMPIMVTGILYGLAMGYQVFLVSSMREAHVHGIRGRASVVHGFDQASRVVVAAAVIMISVFSGFIFSHDIMIKQVGFALAIGIALDAFLVRMTLMPALMDLLADRACGFPACWTGCCRTSTSKATSSSRCSTLAISSAPRPRYAPPT